MEELRIKKRKEREAKDKQEEIEREKKRVEDGKAMGSIKQQLADQEMMKIAEERRREKIESQLAKERVKAQIEQDRRDRKEKEARERGEAPVSTTQNTAPQAVTSPPKGDYSETKLQIRQLDGKPLVQSFKVGCMCNLVLV